MTVKIGDRMEEVTVKAVSTVCMYNIIYNIYDIYIWIYFVCVNITLLSILYINRPDHNKTKTVNRTLSMSHHDSVGISVP